MLPSCGSGGHGLGGADEIIGGLEVEEVEVLEVVVLGRLEHIERDAEDLASLLIDCMEEFEKDLADD